MTVGVTFDVDVDEEAACASDDGMVLRDVVLRGVVLRGVAVGNASGLAKASLLRLFPFIRFLPVISLRT